MCGAENPPGNKFCGTCGTALLELGRGSATATASKPGSSSNETAAQAERRQVTVMFCDLVGSTVLASRLDPEDYRTVITSFQRAVSGAVLRFDGHVAKYLGDGVLACFGYPQAHEDDAEQAVRSGLASVVAVRALVPSPGIKLDARVGIATGLVVAGDIAEEGVSEAGAISGETPNLAARLQTLAAPGAVVIGQSTHKLVAGIFDCSTLGAQQLKGIAQAEPVWQVVEERRAESRFEARRGAGLTEFVGRTDEIELLQRRWERAKQSEGQVALISGEPGIGKSRLTQQMRECLGSEPHTWLRYQCSPHHTNTALYPVSNQLIFASGITADEPAASKLDKLEALLGEGTDDIGSVAPLFADLLSIPYEGRYPPIKLTPQAQRLRTRDALCQQLVGLARRRPVLMVFEDLHWIDPTMQELLDLIVERVQEARVLALMTCRPEHESRWVGQPHVTLLALSRLSKVQCTQMARYVAARTALSAATLEAIAAKTEGVPLFTEELTRALLEGGITTAVPTTLQASLLARLDRLGHAKHVAQVGAVIGREFGYRLLAAVCPIAGPEMEVALKRLVSSELVFQRGEPPEASYIFKHAMVQDTAYESMLKGHRRALHACIARVLEAESPEIVKTQPELLARHFQEAEDADHAAEYWLKAGQNAVARSAHLEAIAHFKNGLRQLEKVPGPENLAQRELIFQNSLGRAFFLAKGYASEEAGLAFDRAQALCRSGTDRIEVLSALWGVWLYHLVCANYEPSTKAAEQALSLCSTESGADSEADASLAITVAICDFHTGRLSTADRRFAKVAPLYSYESDHVHFIDRYGFDFGPMAHAYHGCTRWLLGFPQEARNESNCAYDLADKHSQPYSRVRGYWWSAVPALFRRDWDTVRKRCEASLAASADYGFPLVSGATDVLLGSAIASTGNHVAGIAQIRRGIADYQATRARFQVTLFQALLAQALLAADQPDGALDALRSAREMIDQTGETFFAAEIARLEGETLRRLQGDECADVVAAFHRALEIAQGQAAKSLELRAAMALARLRRDKGEVTKARELLVPVYSWFTEGFDTADLRQAKALLDGLDGAN
jgi:class 3 adenylate cyclase/predicted ATPase